MNATNRTGANRQVWMAEGLITLVLCAALIPLLTGCQTVQDYSLTYRVWSTAEFENWAGPAREPHLALFSQLSENDVLVQYDETTEKKESVRRRAYFLFRNARRIEQRKKPRFVNPETAITMAGIPLEPGNPGMTNLSSTRLPLAAVYDNHAREFWLFRHGKLEGPSDLPAYKDSNGNFIRVILTPFAAAGDTVVVGLVAGIAIATSAAVNYRRFEDPRGPGR
jgi:hypothetical protein